MSDKYSTDYQLKNLFEGFRNYVTEAYGGDKIIHDIIVGLKDFVEIGTQLTDEAYLEHMAQGYMGGGIYQSLTDLATHLDNMGGDRAFIETLRTDMEQLKEFVGANHLDPNMEGFRALMDRVYSYIMDAFPSDIEN